MQRRSYLTGTATLGLACLGGLAGCSTYMTDGDDETPSRQVASDWRPESGAWSRLSSYGPHGNRYNPHASPPRTEPEVDWSTAGHEGFRTPQRFAVAIADGTWYGRTESELYALDLTDGSERWVEPQPSQGTLTYIDGRLYNSMAETEEALTLDGETEWQIDDPSSVIGEMEGHVYTSTEAGLAWHHADTGDRLGSLETDSNPVAVVDGTIYGFMPDGLYAYERERGTVSQQWRAPIEGPYELRGNRLVVADGALFVRVDASPLETRLEKYSLDGERVATETWDHHKLDDIVVVDGVEYRNVTELDPDGDGFVASHLTATGGDTEWTRTFDSPALEPVVANGALYVGVGEDLLSLDATSGETLWTLENMGGRLAIVKDTLYALTDQFYALRA